MKHLLLLLSFIFLSWVVDVRGFLSQENTARKTHMAESSFSRHVFMRENKFTRCTTKLQGTTKLNDDMSCSTFHVRKARYKDLRAATDILLDAFYTPSAVIRPYLFLSELSRLQGNFPYDSADHSFFVACTMITDEGGSSTKEIIIGFVDVDARPGTRINDAPRPYLSDLAVHKDYKRMGVATSLIKCCEVESMKWGRDNLYLRVEQKNDGALKMYSDLGYESLEHPYFGVKDTTILLMKDHKLPSENELSNDEAAQSRVKNTTIAYVI